MILVFLIFDGFLISFLYKIYFMNIAIVLSGGIGSRMGLNIPKQYVLVNNRPVISFCLQTFLEDKYTDAIVIVVADEWKKFVQDEVGVLKPQKIVMYAKPGETRQYSIFNALNVVKDNHYNDEDIVLIHDAARPLVSHALIARCYNGCSKVDGVMPVVPVKDTTYLSKDGKHICSLLDRSQLFCGQSPEAFRFGKYFEIHREMSREELLKINGSTEIAFKAGLDCQMIEGDPINFKITTPEDLASFESIVNITK